MLAITYRWPSMPATPYVAYMDGSKGNLASVMAYNGTSWVDVGPAGFSSTIAFYTSIAINASGTPYVGFFDKFSNTVNENDGNATVMSFNGSSWNLVGPQDFAKVIDYPSVALDSTGRPYVVFEDGNNGNKVTVMSYH
jgi:hypothetical protein